MNSYFTHDTELGARAKAYSAYINARFDEVEAGFDELPEPSELKRGAVLAGTTGGAADAYTISLSYITAYADFQRLLLRIHAVNTGAATLNVSSLGVKSIKTTDGEDPQAGDLPLNGIVELVYDNTAGYFVMVSSIAGDSAAASASATAAAASAAAAATSETNAATSETNAAASASSASSSATAAATSASSASTSETNAATSESNAATSASNAATSETNASNSESTASTAASNASSSASAASTSASNASTSETNAAASATAAAASAALAASYGGVLNKFDATSPPTANDDSADTSGNGAFAVGSTWIDVSADESYRCVDATATAAVWVTASLQLSDLGSMATQDASSVAITGGTLGAVTGSDTNGPAFAGDEAASSTNPTLIPNKSNMSTGIGADGNSISFIQAGSQKMRITNSSIYVYENVINGNTGGYQLQDEVASSTNPTLCPHNSDLTTGLGGDGAGSGYLIGAGVQAFQWTQYGLYAGNAAGPRLANEAATGSNPTLIPNKANENTGIGWNATGQLTLVAGGTEAIRVEAATTTVYTHIMIENAGGPSLRNETASGSNPTLVPNKAELTTGIGWAAPSLMSLIAGGNPQAYISSTGMYMPNAAGPLIENDAASSTNPTLVPNRADSHTGIGWTSNDNGALIAGGARSAFWASGGIYVDNASGAAILNEAASSTNPTLVPDYGDADTGIGLGAANQLSLIAGGSECFRAAAGGNVSYQHMYFSNSAGPWLENGAASATNPTLVPNRADLDTGVGWSAANKGTLVAGGSASVYWDANKAFMANAAGPTLMNEAATATNPTVCPNQADDNTGIGWVSADIMSLIGGGVSVAHVENNRVTFQKGIRETNYSLTGTAIDPTNGTMQYKTLSGNVTFTHSLGNGDSVLLYLVNGSSYTVTWPAVEWVGADGDTAPTLGTQDTLVFWQVNSVFYGAHIGNSD